MRRGIDLMLAMDRANLRDLRAIRPQGSHARHGAAFERVLDLTTSAARGLIAALQQRP